MTLKIFCPSIAFLMIITVCPLFAGDCEIVKTDYFTREQEAIVTDWYAGIPYKKYTVESYPCANMIFRNTFWQYLSSTDIEVTALFHDQSRQTKRLACEKNLLSPNEEFPCSLCFESTSTIVNLECRFR